MQPSFSRVPCTRYGRRGLRRFKSLTNVRLPCSVILIGDIPTHCVLMQLPIRPLPSQWRNRRSFVVGREQRLLRAVPHGCSITRVRSTHQLVYDRSVSKLHLTCSILERCIHERLGLRIVRAIRNAISLIYMQSRSFRWLNLLSHLNGTRCFLRKQWPPVFGIQCE